MLGGVRLGIDGGYGMGWEEGELGRFYAKTIRMFIFIMKSHCWKTEDKR